MRLVLLLTVLALGCEGTIDANGLATGGERNLSDEMADDAVDRNLNNANPTTHDDLTDVGVTDTGGDASNELICPSAECGEALFQVNCEICHGESTGGTPIFPGSIAGFDAVAPIVTNGRGEMVAIPGLSDDDLTSIQMYVDSLADPDESTWTGDEVYERKCAGCHGADGEGTATRGYQLRQPIDGYFEHLTRVGADRLEYNIEMPAYPAITDMQMEEMKAKLRSYPLNRTGEELYNVYCANCHGAAADGGAISQDLLWVKMFGPQAMTADVRQGFFTNDVTNPDFMIDYGPEFFTDAEIESMTIYIQQNL